MLIICVISSGCAATTMPGDSADNATVDGSNADADTVPERVLSMGIRRTLLVE